MTAFWGTLGSLFLIIIGLWKFLRGKNKAKQETLKEAGEDLENAHKNKDASSILDSWDKSNRV